MYRTYAEYRTALDRDDLVAAMHLEAAYHRAVERRDRWTHIGLTALWAVAAFIPTYLFTMVVA